MFLKSLCLIGQKHGRERIIGVSNLFNSMYIFVLFCLSKQGALLQVSQLWLTLDYTEFIFII